MRGSDRARKESGNKRVLVRKEDSVNKEEEEAREEGISGHIRSVLCRTWRRGTGGADHAASEGKSASPGRYLLCFASFLSLFRPFCWDVLSCFRECLVSLAGAVCSGNDFDFFRIGFFWPFVLI